MHELRKEFTYYLLAQRRREEYTAIKAVRLDYRHAEWSYPKNATAQDHPTAEIQVRCKGGTPSLSSSSKPSAGRIPTKPAAKGI